MKVPAIQLDKALNELSSVYFITGDELFQKEEACHQIRTHSKTKGYQENVIYHIESGFDWSILDVLMNHPSLFSDQQVIELRIHESAQITRQAEDIFARWVTQKTSHQIILFIFSKFTKAMEKTAWFKLLEPLSTWVTVWKIEGKQLIHWLSERCKKKGLTLSYEALALLAERTEGNLLAAAQEIDKLPLLVEKSLVTVQHIAEFVLDSSKYDVFKLIDAMLIGETKQVLNIFNKLDSDSVEWLSVLWMVSRELRIISHLNFMLDEGKSLDTAIYEIATKQKIPVFSMKKRRHDYLACVNRVNEAQLKHFISCIASLEQQFKTGHKHQAKLGFLSLILAFASPKSQLTPLYFLSNHEV